MTIAGVEITTTGLLDPTGGCVLALKLGEGMWRRVGLLGGLDHLVLRV